ncbi:ferric-dicitrate binding protein FerR, regulates iron transport through sigma-19 [Chitinophaga eiseniae]|uniref:Ferric-dicitrate binding protein FerR, regulates iron transport through sigma-19 n=1 Tax=Chitinophaga eiseniae TaxID=634771 RepID=A0A1T4SQK0_9BACT|nr:FecR domain-containing protein [Chitinophaga eiseniae]SKA30426.1 ferric-dicitrate binding protein FerR, regulates iron transport through sigma-19 [Chitinophaga eiseniae]
MARKDYSSYTARDFALDEDFQQWVLQPATRNVFWERWLEQHPEKENDVREARQLLQGISFTSFQLSSEQKDGLWEAICGGLEGEGPTPQEPTRTNWWQLWKYAAALLLGMLIAGGWYWWKAEPKNTILSSHTRLGEVKTFLLPDSSEVTLNANSRLLYASAGKQREVWIDGEAFFHVKHTASHQKFIVHTYDNVHVEVLGTQFNVNSTGKEVVVVLQQGKIQLNIEGRNTSLALQPGDIVRYNKQDGDFTKSSVNADQYVSWHTGRLVMEDYSLADAATFMQQVFGKTIIVPDTQLLKYKVSGSMPIIYNADTMLVQLEKVFRMKFNQKGDEVWIQKK